MPKRKYSSYVGAGAARGRKRVKYALKMTPRAMIPAKYRGYLRTGGSYGRFSGGPAGELKFFDTAISFTADATGEVPATGQLCLIPQGTGESARIGRNVVIKSIQLRLGADFVPGGAANASTNLNLYVMQDTQANGAAAGVTDIFTGTNLTSALINLDNSQRFKILKKIRMNLTSAAGVTTAYNSVNKTIDYFRKCHIPMDFSSTTGAITEIRSNNVFLVAGSSDSDDLIAVTGNARVRFSDH